MPKDSKFEFAASQSLTNPFIFSTQFDLSQRKRVAQDPLSLFHGAANQTRPSHCRHAPPAPPHRVLRPSQSTAHHSTLRLASRPSHGLTPLPDGHILQPPATSNPQSRPPHCHNRCGGGGGSGRGRRPDPHSQIRGTSAPSPQPLGSALGLPLPHRWFRRRLRGAPHRRDIPL
jgi:hypothetical protein